MLQTLLVIASLGAIASVARFWLSTVVQQRAGAGFPWGTFAVNAAGCLFFGFVWSLFEKRSNWDPHVRMMILAGFAGAFTTFSTFAFDTVRLIEESAYGLALLNVLGQSTLGIVLIFLGFILGKWF